MSWPPPGVDLSLNETLLARQDSSKQLRDLVLELTRNLNQVLDTRSKGRPDSISPELFAKADDLLRHAVSAGRTTTAMLAGKVCAEILFDKGQFSEALLRLKDVRDAYAAVVRSGGAQERDNDAQLLALMGRGALALQDLQTASAYFGEAINLIEHDRYHVNAPYLQSAFLNRRSEIYAAGVGTAFKLADWGTMLARAELSKARSIMRVQNAPPLDRTDPSLARFWDICNQIRTIDPGSNPQALSDSARNHLNVLLDQRRQLWDLLAIRRFSSAETGPSISLPEIQKALAKDAAVLYYYWLDESVLLVTAIDCRRVVAEPISLSEQERDCLKLVLNVVRSAWPELDARLDSKFDRCTGACSNLIPPKVHELLAGKERLFISPNHQLHLFPFHALPWSSGFLIETFAVSYIPNLSVLLAPSRQPVLARRLIAGVGTFPANFGLSSLPGVEQELKGIAEAYRAAGAQSEATVVLEGTSAVRKQFAEWNRSGVLESFSCIHLATHGSSVLSVDTMDTPMESQLFLSDSAWDGLEISSLRLNPDLVVLSACNSGQRAVAGRGFGELPGDEIFGIQLAFAMAGAKAVIGCLWPTNDEVARAMMIDLHTRVARGCSPETALQSAIVSALRQFDRRHAYLWAPFFLTILGSQPESS